MFRGLKYNGSGYIDLTAYQAIINIYKNSGNNKPFNKGRKSKGKRERTVLMKNKKKIIRNLLLKLTIFSRIT